MKMLTTKSAIICSSVLLLLASHSHAEQGKPLTLAECVEMALKRHPSLRASEMEVAAADAQYRQTVSAYYPQASIDASYTRSKSESLSFVTGETDSYSAYLNVQQTIYDFGRTGGSVDAGRAWKEAKGADLSTTRQDIIFNVKEGYFNLLKNKGLVKVEESSLAQAELHLKQARGFFEAGVKAKFDVTTAEVELNEARLNLIKAKTNLNTSVTTLKNRMGLGYADPLDIEDAVYGGRTEGIVLEEAIREGLSNRPSIKSLEAYISQGEGSLRSSRGGHYPNLYATASVGYYDQVPAGEGENLFQDENRRWNAGITLTIPLFEGFLVNAKVAEARASLESLRAQKEAAVNDVTLEITQAYLELQDAEVAVDVAESGLAKARENHDLANGRYKAGVGTIIEVTDAMAALIKAETDFINTRYDAAIVRASFDRAVGRE